MFDSFRDSIRGNIARQSRSGPQRASSSTQKHLRLIRGAEQSGLKRCIESQSGHIACPQIEIGSVAISLAPASL